MTLGRAHPARITLERFSVEDLPTASMAEVEDHLRCCSECQRAVEDLEAFRHERLNAVATSAFVDAIERRLPGDASGTLPLRPRALRHVHRWAVAAAAIAASVLLGPLLFRSSESIRFKGTDVAVYRLRGEERKRLGDGDLITEADALEVVVTLGRRERVQAWVVESNGVTTPVSPSGAVDLPPGEHILSGGSLIVEAPCRELVVVTALGELADRWPRSEVQKAFFEPPEDLPARAFLRRLRCQ
jgi:hypothetical protein